MLSDAKLLPSTDEELSCARSAQKPQRQMSVITNFFCVVLDTMSRLLPYPSSELLNHCIKCLYF